MCRASVLSPLPNHGKPLVVTNRLQQWLSLRTHSHYEAENALPRVPHANRDPLLICIVASACARSWLFRRMLPLRDPSQTIR